MKTNDFTLSIFDLRYTRFGASGREGAPICDVRHSTSATAMGPRKTVKTIRQTYSTCQSGKKIVRMGGVTSPPTYIWEFWSLQRRIARRKSDRHSFPIGLVPSFTASTLSKLTNVQIEHCRLRRKRLLGLLEQFNRHLTTFSHLLCSQDSTMEVKSQRRKHLKRNHDLHSLNAAIDALHLAKDTTNVRQARDVFASTSSLLATIRVRLFPVSAHRLLVI